MNKRGCLVFLLLVSWVAAQISSVPLIRRVRVRVIFPDGTCDLSTHVKLQGSKGSVADAAPDSECEVDFANIPEGNYDLKVSGQNFASTNSIVMTSGHSNDFEVKVTRAGEGSRDDSAASLLAVSAADLGVPAKAQKEFDKANQMIARQDFTKAIEALKHAIAIYPEYAGAYNNLGVIYARLGDREREREALQKAVSINDHFAPAYVNLGRMHIAMGDFASAEAALNRAASSDPADSMTLVLLTYSEFMDHHVDDAIATSRKAHAMQGSHASVHLVAARSFEQKRDRDNSIAELEMFLKEEPSGVRADEARKELATLQAIHQ